MTVALTAGSSERLHATCVAIAGANGVRGVLLAGRSGTGKSDLALRLIDRGARLVSDDATLVTRHAGALSAWAPVNGAGLLEVRGIGIIATEMVDVVAVALLVELDGAGERLPEAGARRHVAGVALPVVHLDAAAPSAAIKVELALRHLGGDGR